MPTSLLQILNDLLLALLLLFFLRVLRAVWVQLKPAPIPATATATAAPPRPPKPEGAPRKGRLRMVAPEQGEPFDIGEEVTVGRAPGCGISLVDGAVSQVHARLFRRDGKIYVEDLGSTNGTWVNGARISAPQALKRGDRMQVGATVLEVGR